MSKLDFAQKNRLKKTSIKIGIYLALGIAYYFFVLLTDKKIPCLIKLITKKLCPGCGITRMFMELAKGNIAGAAKCNIFVLVLLIPALLWGIYRFIMYVKKNNTAFTKLELVVLVIVLIACMAFGVLRNTEAFSYLAPAL